MAQAERVSEIDRHIGRDDRNEAGVEPQRDDQSDGGEEAGRGHGEGLAGGNGTAGQGPS